MILADVNFPPNFEKITEKQDIYLNNVKKNALSFLKLYQIGNNRNIQDYRIRLNLLTKYIEDTYNININIYKIIKFAISNLEYSLDRKFITLNKDIKLKGVKLLILLKIIKYGTLEVKGSNIFEYCLENAFKATYVNNFLENYNIRQWV